jgi:hypothetical protein
VDIDKQKGPLIRKYIYTKYLFIQNLAWQGRHYPYLQRDSNSLKIQKKGDLIFYLKGLYFSETLPPGSLMNQLLGGSGFPIYRTTLEN